MTNIPINIPVTDSFSLKLPFLDCVILDERLTSKTFTYYESLDAIDTEPSPPKPILIQYNGITIRIGLANIPIWNNETKETTQTQFINLTVSSKLLKQNYFNGINSQNIIDLYNEFLSFEVFFCEFEVFLNGYISDVDICLNLPSASPLHFSNSLELLVHQCGTKIKHTHLINEPDNVGLTFNKRQFAKPSLPFCKFYHKEFELHTKSAEFYNIYLFPEYADQIRNLTRVEVTIKNYAHKERLAKFNVIPQFKTLRDYLLLNSKQLYDVVIFSIYSYIEKKPRQKAPNLSPTDHIIYELIRNCIDKGYDFKSLLNVVTNFEGGTSESTRVAQSRMSKKIKDLFKLLENKDEKIAIKNQHNAHVLEYLNFLNLNL